MKIPDTFCLLVTGTYVTFASCPQSSEIWNIDKPSTVVCGYVRVLSWKQPLERIILPFTKTWLSKKSHLNEKESWTVNWEKENYKRKDQSQGNCAWSWRQFILPTLQTDRAPLLACFTEHLTQPVVYGVWQKYSHQKQDKIFSLQ